MLKLSEPSPWDDEEIAWALECVQAGDSIADIAEAADRTRNDVTTALNRAAVREAGMVGSLTLVEAARRFEVLKQSCRVIALDAGVDRTTMSRALARHGVIMRPYNRKVTNGLAAVAGAGYA